MEPSQSDDTMALLRIQKDCPVVSMRLAEATMLQALRLIRQLGPYYEICLKTLAALPLIANVMPASID
jgi:hypothetical protein